MRKLALLSFLFLGLLSVAAAQGKTTKTTVKSPTVATPQNPMARIDAITSGIVDELWETSDHFWHDGDYYRILAILRVCVEADPEFIDAYASGGYLLWSLQDVKGADEMLLYGTQKAKNKAPLYFELGAHYTRTKRDKEAAPMLEKSLALGENHYDTYSVLANCYRRLGMLEQSLQIWEKAVKKHPTMGAAKVNRDRVKQLIESRNTRTSP
jgi:tetratricopeptide (TPR) repeat protein